MGPEIWLKEMLRRELDLRPPSLAKINENSIIIKDNNNHPIAYAIRSNRWAGFEINSFVIDPAHRGKGLSHKLLEKCGNGRLFAYTRDIRLQSTLGKAGFEREMEKSIKVESAVQRFPMNSKKCNRICTIYFLPLAR